MGRFLHRCYYPPLVCVSESSGHPPAMSMTSLTRSPFSHSIRISLSAKAVQCLPSLLRCQKTLPALVHLQSSHQTHQLCVTSSQIPCHAHVALCPYTRPNSHPNPSTICQSANQPPLHHIPPEILRRRTQHSEPTTPVNKPPTQIHHTHTKKKHKCTLHEEQSQAMSDPKLQHVQTLPIVHTHSKTCNGRVRRTLIPTTFMHLTQTTPSCVHPNLQNLERDPLFKPTQLLRSTTKRSEAKAEVQLHTRRRRRLRMIGGKCGLRGVKSCSKCES